MNDTAAATQTSDNMGLINGAVDWKRKVLAGGWVSANEGLDVREPATGDILATVGVAEPDHIRQALDEAASAQVAWAETDPDKRARILLEAARLLDAHRGELVPWIVRETGGIAPKAQFEINASIAELRHAASLNYHEPGALLHSPDPGRTSFARRVPVGLVVVITPWNFPFVLGMRSVAPALALGNAVLLKPDPHTPVSGGVMLARLFQEAGLPDGLLAMLSGGASVGEALVTAEEPRMVTFTGSTAVGRRVGELAGRNLKRVALELGGNGAMIVLDDADIDGAISCGSFGSFSHQGQVCMATGRHIVHRSVVEEYTRKLAEKAMTLPVGNPATDQVALGPIINNRQIERIDRIVRESIEQGATLVVGGRRDDPYFYPTVLAGVRPGMPAFDEEIFGPVAPIVEAEDDEEAVELANNTAYGLSASVQSRSFGRAHALARRLKVGMVHINDQTINDLPQIPMGGRGQSGNGSRFGTINNIEEFTEYQWMTMSAEAPPYP